MLAKKKNYPGDYTYTPLTPPNPKHTHSHPTTQWARKSECLKKVQSKKAREIK